MASSASTPSLIVLGALSGLLIFTASAPYTLHEESFGLEPIASAAAASNATRPVFPPPLTNFRLENGQHFGTQHVDDPFWVSHLITG